MAPADDRGLNRAARRTRDKALRGARRRRRLAIASGTALIAGSGVLARPAHAATFTVANLNDSGAGSLRQAILDSNSNGVGADIIAFQGGLTGTITLTTGEIDITGALEIQGPGAGALTVSGNDRSRIFDVVSGGTDPVTIRNLRVHEGRAASGGGGALRVADQTLTLDAVTISGSVTDQDRGGGLHFASTGTDALVITGSTFTGNSSAERGGGAFMSTRGAVTVDSSTFTANAAQTGSGWGAGFYATGDSVGTIVVTGSTFTGNNAQGLGGGFGTDHMGVTVSDTTVTGNTSDGGGAGIWLRRLVTVATLTDVTITDNTAGTYGGGLFNEYGVGAVVTDSTITGNVATGSQGGGVVTTGAFELVSSTVSDNDAYIAAGIASSRGDLTVTESTIARNTATLFAGGILTSSVDAIVESSTISDNSAGTVGGGIDANGGTLSVVDSTISGNTAAGDGGGLRVLRGDVSLAHSTVTGNVASGVGDGIHAEGMDYYGYLYPASVTLEHVIVAGNETQDVTIGAVSTATASWSVVQNVANSGLSASGSNVVGVDALLGALADNGGSTFTHLPADASPAVNAGNASVLGAPASDQRGATRIQGGRIDIGSVETAVVPAPLSSTGPDPNAPPPSSEPPPGSDPMVRDVPPPDRPGERSAVTLETSAGDVTLEVDTGGRADATVSVTVTELDEDEVQTTGFKLLDVAFEVEVTGVTGGGRVCFPYSQAAVDAAGIVEEDMQIFHFVDGRREALPTTVDAGSNQVCAEVSSFSPFAIGVLQTERLAGESAVATAVAISAARFAAGVPVVHLVTRDAFDALGAGSTAAKVGGPVLLVERDRVPGATAAELQRLSPERVVVVGGTDVISDTVVADLGASRVAGLDRFATAARLSESAFEPGVPAVYVASGASVADALVAGAAAGATGAPLLLVDRDTVPGATAAELERLRPGRVVVIGGTAAVSDAVLSALGATRIAGVDRYATAAVLASELDASSVFAARGDDPVDALAGISAAAADGAAIVLVTTDAVPDDLAAVLHDLGPAAITILGGIAAVSLQTEVDLAAFLPD